MSPKLILGLAGTLFFVVGLTLAGVAAADNTGSEGAEEAPWESTWSTLTSVEFLETETRGLVVRAEVEDGESPFMLLEDVRRYGRLEKTLRSLLVEGDRIAIWCRPEAPVDPEFGREVMRVEVEGRTAVDRYALDGGGPVPGIVGVFGAVIAACGFALLLAAVFGRFPEQEERTATVS